MIKTLILFFTAIFCLLLFQACANPPQKQLDKTSPEIKNPNEISEQYQKYIKLIEPFFKPMGEPAADEWLATFSEKGQTFEQYINSNPTLPTGKRNKIYIQPIGKFDKQQLKVIEYAAEYLKEFFQLPVHLEDEKQFNEPLSLENYRIHPDWKIKQIRTGYVLDNLLLPVLPEDAAAMIAFTSEDLYPDKNFNFVFGQASFENRVGVWSLYRLKEDANFKIFLTRILKNRRSRNWTYVFDGSLYKI